MNNVQLNFPYYFYPNIPFCGYMNTKEYNKNLIKLNDLLLSLQNTQTPILLHISIGASAEEIISGHLDHKWNNQWIQLFPQHLQTAIENDIEIVHIIIAPNKFFSTDPEYCEYKDPLFIRNTSHFEWVKHDNVYRSKTKPISVYIFYTMMPTIDERNNLIIKSNVKRFSRICESFSGFVAEQYLIKTYIQTVNDIKFTSEFYSNLKNVIEIIKTNGGIVTCFSFAVFCETTNKFIYGQKYNMFKEITTVGCDILAEWRFVATNYLMFEYNNKQILSYEDNSIQITKNDTKLVCDCEFIKRSPKRKISSL